MLRLSHHYLVLCSWRISVSRWVGRLVDILILHGLDTLPLATQVLLPQRDLVIAATNSEHVTAETPADTPDSGIEAQDLAGPLALVGSIARPDAHRPVLRRGRDVALLQHGRAPGHVAHPVGVAGEGLALLLVALGGRVVSPDLEDVVAAAGDEAALADGARLLLLLGRRRRRGDDAAGGGGRGPRDRVDAEAVRRERHVRHVVVLELEHADVAVGRGARQQAARLVRGPGHRVHRRLVQREVEDPLPLRGLLAPDEHLAVV